MKNFPRVKLSRINGDKKYECILDMTISYRQVLQERLRILRLFIANNTLQSATQAINEAGVSCSEKEVNKVLFGHRGILASIEKSLNGGHGSSKLIRRDGSPFFFDQNGKQYLRGVVVDGHYPLHKPSNTLTAIRNWLEVNLNLPRYIRHLVDEFDETVDRDYNNNLVAP